MTLKKSELYSSLWKSCDELRGGMDASQYKDYVSSPALYPLPER
jgi:type I restriction enzyme M protein